MFNVVYRPRREKNKKCRSFRRKGTVKRVGTIVIVPNTSVPIVYLERTGDTDLEIFWTKLVSHHVTMNHQTIDSSHFSTKSFSESLEVTPVNGLPRRSQFTDVTSKDLMVVSLMCFCVRTNGFFVHLIVKPLSFIHLLLSFETPPPFSSKTC